MFVDPVVELLSGVQLHIEVRSSRRSDLQQRTHQLLFLFSPAASCFYLFEVCVLRNLHQLHVLLLGLDREGLLQLVGGAAVEGDGDHLQLEVLAPVVPLEQDAALPPAAVEAAQGRLVLLHLLQHLGAQLHHRLVVADGQDQHVSGGQRTLSQSQVALQHARLSVRECFKQKSLRKLQLTCVPMLNTRCFST